MPDLWLDSTTCRRPGPLRRLCRAASRNGYRVRIHPQITLEQARSMACYCHAEGRTFSVEKFRSFPRQLGIEFEAFSLDEATAIEWGPEWDMLRDEGRLWTGVEAVRQLGIQPRG